MSGFWSPNESPRSLTTMICKLLVVLSILLNLIAADQIKDRIYRSDDEIRAQKGRNGLDHANLRVQQDEATLENLQGIPSRSYHTPKQRSDAPSQQKRQLAEDKERFTKVAENGESRQPKSINSANALATLQPVPPVQKPLNLRKRDSFAVSTIEDWKLENFVIFITIDGTIHARTRDTGKELWAWQTSPLFESKRHKSRSRVSGQPPDAEDDIEWIVEAVGGGQLYWYSQETGLEKLPFSIKEFVDVTPRREGDKWYNGEKKTELYTLDPRTGALLFTSAVGSTDKSCRKMGLEGLDDDECPKKQIILGKTEYTVTIRNEDEELWTIKYVEWAPGNPEADLAYQYDTPLDHKYFMSLHDGSVVVRDVSRLGKKEYLRYQFETPVVRGFDVVTKDSNSFGSDHVSLVLLPQPADSKYGNGEEKCYISYLSDSGYFAMSEKSYPGNTGGAGDAVGTSVQRIASKPKWNKMDDDDRKEYLVGVHKLQNERYAQDALPFPGDMNLSQNRPRTTQQGHPKTISPPEVEDKIKPAWVKEHMLEILLSISLAGAIAYILTPKISQPHRKLEGISFEEIEVQTDQDITSNIPMLTVPETPGDTTGMAVVVDDSLEEPKINIPEVQMKDIQVEAKDDLETTNSTVSISVNETKKTETAVRFLEPESDPSQDKDDKENNENNEKGEVKKKKARRGTRGGKRRKGPSQDIKDVAYITPTDISQQQPVHVEFKAVIPSPEPLQDHDEGTLPGDLVVTDQVLGYGSHGTIVFRGTFEGKDVAVKRMLLSFYDIASHEVALLQESDDHPNVVRYYCKQQKGQFLYIALELCPASLYDITDHPNLYENIVQHMHPPDVLKQITLGLQHLHSLKIVHRDIKPQNILVTAPKSSIRDPSHITPPRLLISDFGLCKKLEPDQSSFRATTAHAAGTTGWRAPELLMTDEGAPPLASMNENSTTGSTSDGAVLDTLTNRRATRAIDIFSLGCVFYYVLTKGQHPFGDRYMREANIIQDNTDLSHLDILGDAGVEAKDLISRMIRRNPKERPDASTVLLHPFFWSVEKKLKFINDVSDLFEGVQKDDPNSYLLQFVEDIAPDVFKGGDWTKQLDRVFVEELMKRRKYSGTKMVDLLRSFRNKINHHRELPQNLKNTVGIPTNGILDYYTSHFPQLIMRTYYVVCKPEFRNDPALRYLFSSI